jgi:hypothetical protein
MACTAAANTGQYRVVLQPLAEEMDPMTTSKLIGIALLLALAVGCSRPPPPPAPTVEVVRAPAIHFGAATYEPPSHPLPQQPAQLIHEGLPEEIQARVAALLQARGFRILVDDRAEGLITARYTGPGATYVDCGTITLTDPALPPLVVSAVEDRIVQGTVSETGARLVETRSHALNVLLTLRFGHYAAALAPSARVTGTADYALASVTRRHVFDPARPDGLGQLVDAAGSVTRFTSESGATMHASPTHCVPSGGLEWSALRV